MKWDMSQFRPESQLLRVCHSKAFMEREKIMKNYRESGFCFWPHHPNNFICSQIKVTCDLFAFFPLVLVFDWCLVSVIGWCCWLNSSPFWVFGSKDLPKWIHHLCGTFCILKWCRLVNIYYLAAGEFKDLYWCVYFYPYPSSNIYIEARDFFLLEIEWWVTEVCVFLFVFTLECVHVHSLLSLLL